MRYTFTLILLILNILVFGLISYEFLNPNTAHLSTDKLKLKLQAVLTDPTRIELLRGGLDSSILIERSGMQWHFAAPENWAANPFAVNNLINQLQFLEVVASFSIDEIQASQQSLKDYGLESPQLTITVESVQQTLSLAIGTQTAQGNTLYLLGPEKQFVYVVKMQLLENLIKNIQSLKSHQIFTIPLFELEGLHFDYMDLKNKAAKIKLERSHDQWNLTSPLIAAADNKLVQKVLSEITNLHLSSFVEASELNNRPLNFDNSDMRLTLLGNNRYQSLLIGPETPDQNHYYAKLANSSAIFTIQKPLIDQLSQMHESLRERHFMRILPSELQAINLISKNRNLRLQRLETDDWQILSHGMSDNNSLSARAADPAFIAEFIDSIHSLQATDFVSHNASALDLKSYGFDQASIRIELIDKSKNSTTLLLAHPPENPGQLYAKRMDENSIYGVDRTSTLQRIPLNEYNYWLRNLPPLPAAAQIVKLSLQSLDKSHLFFEFSLDETHTDWDALRQELSPEQSDALKELLDTMRKPSVKRYLSMHFNDESYSTLSKNPETAPWDFRLSAHIDLPAGDNVKRSYREIILSDRLSGTQQIGGSPQDTCTFLLTSNTIAALYVFTESMPLPPELKGEFVAPALPIDPLTDPEPIGKQP
jgi:hypothetical protein